MKNFPSELRHGSGAMMTLDSTRLLLALREPTDPGELTSILEEFGLMLEEAADSEQEKRSGPFDFVNHTDRAFWLRTRTNKGIDQERFDGLQTNLAGRLDWLGPVYRLGDVPGRGGLLCPLPAVLLIKQARYLSDRQREDLDTLLANFGASELGEKSTYLGDYRYYILRDVAERNAYALEALLIRHEELVSEAQFENMPMIVPIAVVPNDIFFVQQWSMSTIQAGGAGITGWDISTGAAGTIICILDSGVDRHPDLTFAAGALGQGINLGTMAPNGAPVGSPDIRPHGTCCAGIAAARFNNNAGVAGVAGTCSIVPVAFQNWTDAEVAAGINWAANNGAHVISMSFRQYAPGDGMLPIGWNFAVIDPAITNAVNVRGCVLVAATGNEDTGIINGYPARNPLCIAVGGSDQADNRKSPASADGECWGANFGPGISVVAPSVLNPSTDIQGADGYNTNGGPRRVACVNYPVCGDAAGDYFFQFNGTSSATPHVAGLAGAIRAAYPALTNLEVRNIIERTAQKVGGVYADVANFPNGTRTAQMGYGRVNMLRALDLADTLIRDWTGDTGAEPSNPPAGNFWTFSDVVLRITDDDVFQPGDPTKSSNVERGQTNYIYVRVTNNGPRDARNVVVSTRITPYVGLEFVYPGDWTAVDATHVSPTPATASFATVPAGSMAVAKFTVSSAQVDTLWGWISGSGWHPCLLASVNADNDYAFATASTTGGGLVTRRNNLAQRNLSVIDVLASASVTFPFLAAHTFNKERVMDIVLDRRRLPATMPLLLALDEPNLAFPLVDLTPVVDPADREDEGIVFLERTRIEAALGCCRGVLTLAKGSRFDCPSGVKLGKVSVNGGEVLVREGRRFVETRDEITVVRLEKQAGGVYPLALQTIIPAGAEKGETFMISVSQENERKETVGGASVVYTVR